MEPAFLREYNECPIFLRVAAVDNRFMLPFGTIVLVLKIQAMRICDKQGLDCVDMRVSYFVGFEYWVD